MGIDLHLNPTVSAEKLKERLGAESVSTAAEHRRRVATHLFGLHDETRYSNLLHLLRRLRNPNIGNRIEAGELAAVLRDALPPPSGEALKKAADRFDTLDQVREQLARQSARRPLSPDSWTPTAATPVAVWGSAVRR